MDNHALTEKIYLKNNIMAKIQLIAHLPNFFPESREIVVKLKNVFASVLSIF
jgi:hypothetical protein